MENNSKKETSCIIAVEVIDTYKFNTRKYYDCIDVKNHGSPEELGALLIKYKSQSPNFMRIFGTLMSKLLKSNFEKIPISYNDRNIEWHMKAHDIRYLYQYDKQDRTWWIGEIPNGHKDISYKPLSEYLERLKELGISSSKYNIIDDYAYEMEKKYPDIFSNENELFELIHQLEKAVRIRDNEQSSIEVLSILDSYTNNPWVREDLFQILKDRISQERYDILEDEIQCLDKILSEYQQSF